MNVEADHRMVSDTIREKLSLTLSGATVREFWTDPETKILYALVVLDPETVNQAKKQATSAALRKTLANDEAGLNKALDRLDAALAAPSNP